jgi:hypothetical protein
MKSDFADDDRLSRMPDRVAAQCILPAADLKVAVTLPHDTTGMLTFLALGG